MNPFDHGSDIAVLENAASALSSSDSGVHHSLRQLVSSNHEIGERHAKRRVHGAKDPRPSMELHSREALAPVIADLNITNDLIVVNIMFRVCIADCRRAPVRIQGFTYLLLLRGSPSLWNEARNAGFHHFIQPLSGLNSIDLLKRVFRKGSDVEILSRAGRSPGRGKQSRAALHRPSQQHLCRRLCNSRGDSRNDWIFEQPRPHPVT
jgi:hypothetical protein